jgi:hypothetical protein
VTVAAKGLEAGPAMDSPLASAHLGSAGLAGSDSVEPDSGGGTAAQRYGWAPSLYDFAWVLGESLTSPPWRGTKRKGWWQDYSDGGGRTSKDGGGLLLDSKRRNDVGPGDFGTTMATLHGNAIKFGRWETKLWPSVGESADRDYTLRFELVPAKAEGDTCRTITVAEFTAHGDTVKFGANAHGKQWSGSAVVGQLDQTRAYAIELTDDHITWFIDGQPVGTVKEQKAISKVPMTMRLSMVGDGDAEMNRTELKSDWQRGYPLDRSEEVTSGAPLTRRTLAGC